jgi:predicted lipid carrier protein YhbT
MLNPARLALRIGEQLLPLGRHLPFVLQQQGLQQLTGWLFAAALADGRFDLLRGRWLRLEVSDLGLAWCISRGPAGLQVAARAPVDVCIRGNWREFLLLASRREDPDTLFFRRRLLIEGDTELGLAVKNLIDSLDPDDLPTPLWHLLGRLGDELGAEAAARTG